MVARVDQKMPVRVLLPVVCNPANDAPAPTGFRLDEHRHMLHAMRNLVICFVDHCERKTRSEILLLTSDAAVKRRSMCGPGAPIRNPSLRKKERYPSIILLSL